MPPDCAGWQPNWMRPGLRHGVLGGLGARCRADDRRADRCRAADRPVDVCVEVGMRRRAHRLPVPGPTSTTVARAVVASPHAAPGRRRRVRGGARPRRLAGEAGRRCGTYLSTMRSAVLRLATTFETDDVMVTAGGSTYFDLVAEMLTGMARRPRGSHRAPQRVLPDPRRRAVPAHVAAWPSRPR